MNINFFALLISLIKYNKCDSFEGLDLIMSSILIFSNLCLVKISQLLEIQIKLISEISRFWVRLAYGGDFEKKIEFHFFKGLLIRDKIDETTNI